MIFDNLSNAMQYAGLSPRFEKAFRFLTETDLNALTERVDLEGNDLYVLPQQPALKTREEARWEAHRRYADIQVVLSGEERMEYAPMDSLTVTEEYNEAKDVIRFSGEGILLRFRAGDFAVYFPQDVHKPNLRPADEPAGDRKLVVKVLL